MGRGNFHEDQDSQDSFLDVVANVVGVLIILVMLVGMQASRGLLAKREQAPEELSPTTVEPIEEKGLSAAQLAQLKEEVQNARRDALRAKDRVTELANKVIGLAIESESHDRQRNELAIHREVMEQEIERRRLELSEQEQKEFDVQRALLDSKLELEELNQEKIVLASAPSDVEEIECVPTPQARITEVPSIHLRLSKGLVSIVPVEELRDELRPRFSEIQRRLQSRNKVVETAGPIEGYRAKFVAIRVARPPVGGTTVGRRAQNTLEQYSEFIPITEDIGENVEQALQPGSKVYEYLQSHRRQSPPVDVWLYTDSFSEFRPLKKALWEMGFAISTRPMPPGATIGASPSGTKSAAQ